MIDDCTVDEFAGSIINGWSIGNDWLEFCVCDMLVRTKSHAPGYQNLAIQDVFRHRTVFPLRMFVHAMARSMTFLLMVSPGERVMPRLFTSFSIRHGPVGNRENLIVASPAEMLADGDSVIGNECNFHVFRIHRTYPF